MTINNNLAVFCFISICFVIVFTVFIVSRHSRPDPKSKCPLSKIKKDKKIIRDGKDFYIYNYYNTPIDVSILEDKNKVVLKNSIGSGQKIGLNSSDLYKYLQNNSIVQVYTNNRGKFRTPMLIGESKLITPENKSIKSLHIGMSSGHDDLSMASESTKSTLGSALSHIRLVNTTPRCMNLTIGSDKVKLHPHSSHMYYGENNMGIHLGAIVRDDESLLNDYYIDKPITDLHLGIISDAKTPLHNGSKFGGDFDDTVDVVNYPMEIHGLGGPHNGTLRDKCYIP